MFLVSRGSSLRTYLSFTVTGAVPCGGRKTSPRTSSKCILYISWSFGITGLILIQFENRVPLKSVLRGVGSLAPLYYCSWTDSIKPSLLFHFFDVRIFIQNLFYSFRTAGVGQCGGRKISPRTSSYCILSFFWSSGIIGGILSQFEN